MSTSFNLFSFTGKMRTLHLTWFAFFLTFVVWFNLAPMLRSIQESLGLTKDQVTTLLILNVALTIPARIVIGMLTDLYGGRKCCRHFLRTAQRHGIMITDPSKLTMSAGLNRRPAYARKTDPNNPSVRTELLNTTTVCGHCMPRP